MKTKKTKTKKTPKAPKEKRTFKTPDHLAEKLIQFLLCDEDPYQNQEHVYAAFKTLALLISAIDGKEALLVAIKDATRAANDRNILIEEVEMRGLDS